MVPVARRNLLAEKARLAMSVAGVAFAVLLVLIVLSLYRGWSDIGASITRLPGDLWVTQAGTNELFRSSSLLPDGKEQALQEVRDVQVVMPVYAREMGFERNGSDYNVVYTAFQAPVGVQFPAETEARYLPGPGEITIDSVFSQKSGLRVGDTMDVQGRRLKIVHINGGGNTVIWQTAFINATDARAIFATPGYVNYYLIALQSGADQQAARAALAKVVPGSEVQSSEDFSKALSRDVSAGFLPVVGVLVGIGIVVGGAVVALTTYTATIERSRDFGVLKALGASSGYLYRIVITQSVIVGVLGSVLGVAASALAASLIKRWIPEFITDLRPADAGLVFGAALVMAALASFVPARRINSIDPAMVFRA